MPMQRSKGSGGEEACRREALEAEQHELDRGIRRAKGRCLIVKPAVVLGHPFGSFRQNMEV